MTSEETNLYNVWITAIGAVSSAIAVLATVLAKKNKNKTDIKIEELRLEEERAKKDLETAINRIKELEVILKEEKKEFFENTLKTKEDLEKKNELINNYEKKLHAVRVSFALLMLQYEKVFAEDKTSMALMRMFYEKIISND